MSIASAELWIRDCLLSHPEIIESGLKVEPAPYRGQGDIITYKLLASVPEQKDAGGVSMYCEYVYEVVVSGIGNTVARFSSIAAHINEALHWSFQNVIPGNTPVFSSTRDREISFPETTSPDSTRQHLGGIFRIQVRSVG